MISPAELERWTQALLEASGLEAAAAETVAVSLVDANRRAVDSHGVARVPVYCERLRAGHTNGRPQPQVERADGAVALVDADQGPGQVAGVFATDLSIELAAATAWASSPCTARATTAPPATTRSAPRRRA